MHPASRQANRSLILLKSEIGGFAHSLSKAKADLHSFGRQKTAIAIEAVDTRSVTRQLFFEVPNPTLTHHLIIVYLRTQRGGH